MLDCAGLRFPHDEPAFVSIGQSEFSISHELVGTVVPGLMVWIAHEMRLCLGRGRLRFQGIWLDEDYSESCDAEGDQFLGDLGGNSFAIPHAAAAGLLAYYGLALGEKGVDILAVPSPIQDDE